MNKFNFKKIQNLSYYLFFYLLLFSLNSCNAKKDILIKNNRNQNFKIYEKIKFKKNDVFVLDNLIDSENIKKYKKFNIIFYSKNNIVESYFLFELLSYQKDPSLLRPFKIIYKSTKKGLIAGAKFGYKALPLNKIIIKDKFMALVFIAIPAVTSVVGFTGGLTKGLIKGIPRFGNEIQKFFSSKEYNTISYNKYFYDKRNRIREVRIFSNDDKLLAVYNYYYKNNSTNPFKTELIKYVK